MFRFDSKRQLQLPKWAAVLVGFGTLFAGTAQADKLTSGSFSTDVTPPNPADSRLDEVLVRVQDDKVFLSERNGEFKELTLNDSPEVAYLKTLLRDSADANGYVTVPIGSIIVANGGSNTDGSKPKGKKKSTPKQGNG